MNSFIRSSSLCSRLKYPPGNAIVLAPATWFGVAALGPVVLAGIAAAFLFSVAKSLSNSTVGALTLLIWLSAQRTLSIRASYFSENLTGALWLIGWWAVLKWRADWRLRYLLVAFASLGLMAATRPLTALGYGAPLTAITWWLARRRQLSVQFMAAGVAGLIVLSAMPIYNRSVTGRWTTLSWTAYAGEYSPFERLGFGLSETRPGHLLPNDMEKYNKSFERIFRDHIIANVPSILAGRILAVINDVFEGWRICLLVTIPLAGAVVSTREICFGLASAASVLICYLSYAHFDTAPYYVEMEPLLAFVAALGAHVCVTRCLRSVAVCKQVLPVRYVTSIVAATCLVSYWMVNVHDARSRKDNMMRGQRSFFERANALGGENRIVFIRYGPEHNIHHPLIQNEPDAAKARVWYVYHHGPDNSDLMKRFPDRTPYLYDEGSDTFSVFESPAR